MSAYGRLMLVVAISLPLIITGCGGDDAGPTPEPPAATPETATIVGRVVEADSPLVGIGGAVITVEGVGIAQTAQADLPSAMSDLNGDFRIDDIPVTETGTVNLNVETIGTANYGNQKIKDISLTKDQEVHLTVAVLPLSSGTPVRLTVTPKDETVDLNGIIQFDATVQTTTAEIDAQPTWYLTSDIGTIDVNGHFTALNQGTGEVVATIGGIRDTANVMVTPPRAPQITTVVVDPKVLSAQGGDVQVTAAVNDGDGVDEVIAQIVDPDNNIKEYALSLVSGTTPKDGTYRVTIPIDPNEIRQDQEDATRTLTYSIRVRAKDNRNNQQVSDFHDVTVPGLDVPPSPF